MINFIGRNKKTDILAYLGITVYLVFVLIPLGWLVMSSFKSQVDIFSSPIFFFKPTLESYISLMNLDFLRAFVNSAIVTTSSIGISVFIGSLAGFALSRYKIPKNSNFGLWLLSTRMLPSSAVVLPYYFMISKFNLFDTVWALVMVYTTFNLALVTWLMWIFFDEIPLDIDEAAMIDGCSKFQTFMKIILPLSKFNLVTVAVLCAIFSWNEFLFALTLTEVSARTLPVHLMHFRQTFRIQWDMMASAGVLVIIPILLFTWFGQKYLVRGLTLGTIK